MTKSSNHRHVPRFLIATGIVTILAATAWHLMSAIERANAAGDNLLACKRTAAKIERLRERSQHASLVSLSISDLANSVEAAAMVAAIPKGNIVRIDPQAVRRIGESDYQEQSTEVELQAVTVMQLKKFLDHLSQSDSNFSIHNLQLRTPHQDTSKNGERWRAEAVLTQHIYAPKSSPSK